MRKVVRLELTEQEREELLNAIEVIQNWADCLHDDNDFQHVEATKEIDQAADHLAYFLDSFFPDILGEKEG